MCLVISEICFQEFLTPQKCFLTPLTAHFINCKAQFYPPPEPPSPTPINSIHIYSIHPCQKRCAVLGPHPKTLYIAAMYPRSYQGRTQ